MPFMWPPRPENAVNRSVLGMYESMGWVAQLKMNGTCTVLEYDPATGALQAWTRHNEPHKLWTPNLASPSLRKLCDLKGGRYVFVGELLHSKVSGIKDTVYLFDILVSDGVDLVGKTYQERQTILHGLWPVIQPGHFYNIVDERLWIANVIKTGFRKEFDSLSRPEEEGLVFKSPQAELEPCWRESANSIWQAKCRRPTKNYGS